MKFNSAALPLLVLILSFLAGCGTSGALIDLDPAKVDIQDEDGDTLLMSAVTWGQIEDVRILLAKGANVHLKNLDGDTALRGIALFNRPQRDRAVLKLLLQHGANINDRDPDGDTALHTAVYSGHVEHVLMLTENGADVNNRNILGRTPIWEVCRADTPQALKIADILLANGADINSRDKDRDTMSALLACDENEQLLTYLRSKGLQ